MGAWGPGIFENDTASDWLDDLLESGDLGMLEAILRRIQAAEGPALDADLGSEALAACEVIARLHGRGARMDDPETERELDRWVAEHAIEPSETLLAGAVAVVYRVLGPGSELRELWAESGSEDDWRSVGLDLRTRLGGRGEAPPAPPPPPTPPPPPVRVPIPATPTERFTLFGARALAYLIDVLPITALAFGLFWLMPTYREALTNYWENRTDPEAIEAFRSWRSLTRNVSMGLYIVYSAFMESSPWQATVGKRMLRLKAVGLFGQRLSLRDAFSRNIAKILSSLVCGVGFLWMLWDRNADTWHDKIGRTRVTHDR